MSTTLSRPSDREQLALLARHVESLPGAREVHGAGEPFGKRRDGIAREVETAYGAAACVAEPQARLVEREAGYAAKVGELGPAPAGDKFPRGSAPGRVPLPPGRVPLLPAVAAPSRPDAS